MSEKRYRCMACRSAEFPWGFDFSSHDPQCPQCKATDNAILPLVTIHFYTPDQANGPIVGENGKRFRVACKPNSRNIHGVPCSGEPRAVNCPECIKTKEHAEAMDREEASAGGILLS